MQTIYHPKGEAGEYAEWAANPYQGCGHRCLYCYVPLTPWWRVLGKRAGQPARHLFDQGAHPREDFLRQFTRRARLMAKRGILPQVFLSFMSDVYHAGDTSLTRDCIVVLIETGLAVCILSKGGTRALRDIGLFRPRHDCYAATLTSLDDAFSLKWEPSAPLPADRLAALKAFHRAGIWTWVSLEPVLDVKASLAIINATHGFVDHYKCGRINHNGLTKQLDWADYTARLIDRLQHLGKSHYIKADLQPYLPRGYANPLRIAQHH